MNNRPIKFRIWDRELGIFENYADLKTGYLEEILIHPKGFLVVKNAIALTVLDENRYVAQQFTGALDKNQQKIFEGDIVLFDNPDPYDGQDQLTKIVGYNSRVMGFRLYNFTHEVDKYGGQVFFPEEVEVIGNIFEGAIKDGINYGEYLKEK